MDLSQRIIESLIKTPYSGSLLDYLCSRFSYKSREEWLLSINSGEIELNQILAIPNATLSVGDCLAYKPVNLIEPEVNLAFNTLYEDEFLIVIDKPGNLPIHPAGPYFKHTLWYLLTQKYGAIHPVNRLDRETSGIVLVAKNPKCAAALSKIPKDKRYLSLVKGVISSDIIAKGFLIQDTSSEVRKKLRFVTELPSGFAGTPPPGVETRFFPRETDSVNTLVEAQLITGKTHQIRATLYSLGFPLLGDKLYGFNEKIYLNMRSKNYSIEELMQLGMPRQALHSWRLEFIHPYTQEKLEITAPVPEDFRLAFGAETHLLRP